MPASLIFYFNYYFSYLHIIKAPMHQLVTGLAHFISARL
jgi:hypothetical protein